MIEPRIRSVPACSSSLGDEALDFCRSYGLSLDDWQEAVLVDSLGLNADRQWSAFEVAVNVARQNGKNEIALARELIGLFLIGEHLLIHSAHEFKTSTEHQRRIESIIQDSPDLHAKVKRNGYRHSHGEEGIELRTGQRIRFMTRTKGGGRGHTGDLVAFDEAMQLPQAMLGALMPVLSARSVFGNPQLWYFFTAVDQLRQDHGLVAAKLRERGIAGDDPSLAYWEWSADVGDPAKDRPDLVDERVVQDSVAWLQANPALRIRISEAHVLKEQRSMDARTFAVERLGIGDWPDPDSTFSVFDMGLWRSLFEETSVIVSRPTFAFDVPPDRSMAAISVAGKRADGLHHIEVVDYRRGTGWLQARLKELAETHDPAVIVCDAGSPAGALVAELELDGLEVLTTTATELGYACGLFFDTVNQENLRHLDTSELNAAVRGAAKRTLGDAWAWSRKNSSVDISPLVSCTLALWGSVTAEKPAEVFVGAW